MKLAGMTVSAVLLAAVSLAAPRSCPAQAEKEKLYDNQYALVIGISHYENSCKDCKKWPDIPNASNDSESIAKFLADSGFEVTRLPNDHQPANKQAIEHAFIELARKVKENDGVVIFFAGHGDTETFGGVDRGYIVPYDATDDPSTFVDMDDLKKYSKYMKTAKHQLFIMDSCYGGTLGQDVPSRAAIPSEKQIKTGTYLRDMTMPTAREVLTAGGKDQKVLDGGGADPNHSFFTSQLLRALRDGRADYDNDGYITFQELVTYIRANASNEKQTPHWDTLEGHIGGRDFVFTSPSSIRRKIQIAEAFEPADPSLEQDPQVQMMWPRLLLRAIKDLQDEGRVYAEFSLSGAEQETRTRGDSGSASSVKGATVRSDYVLVVKYLPLDKKRIRVEAQFKKSLPNLPDIPVVRRELLSDSPDFNSLAQDLRRQFAPQADIHLHLAMVPQCPNCPAGLKQQVEGGQVESILEAWLMQLNLPRMKYLKDKDKDSTADVDVNAMMYVSTKNDRSVLKVNLYVQTAKGTVPFIVEAEPGAWTSALQDIEKQVGDYLADLLKQL